LSTWYASTNDRDIHADINQLEPFQELPQLLDPHLDKFVPVLADAFLASLQASARIHPTANAQLLMPISKAICKLLYTFCKIRGDKVIVRFWSTETRYLELLLTAIESNKPAADAQEDKNTFMWEWEERYITLLWLSQLLLAPFDLSSISSNEAEDVVIPTISGLSWPANVPTITLRAISLGIQYLSSSGKERDAAKILLVRIAMRRDMQSLGIQGALLKWAMTFLQSSTDLNHTTYHYIGVLSFLAAVLISSVGTTNIDSFVEPISQVVQIITTEDSQEFKAIRGSAVARKVLVKILRTIIVLLLQNSDPSPEMIEFSIGHMLESLADSATPVRLAASKALSIITLKLPSEMADQVVEEVLDSLKKNLLWNQKGGRRTRNLSRVNPLEWHGLTLTLSHLVYRQSIPPKDLAPVLDALRLALSFEQRSTSGASIGTNVRDAACFGIWAVARRYQTSVLENLHLSPDVTTDSKVEASVSALQTLANDLVVSACVDPAGNIRRGSSAALQELIGRHPDTVLEGIQVVQVVDYHAVALRTRAISDVAVKSAKLSEEYREAILQALLGWRGVRDGNPATRKVAASTFGALVWQRHLELFPSWRYLQSAIDEVARQVKQLESREINECHGLILAISELALRVNSQLEVDNLHTEFHRIQKHGTFVAEGVPQDPDSKEESGLYTTLVNINCYLVEFLKDFKNQARNSRQQDLLAEAFSELVVATSPIPRRLTLFGKFDELRNTDTGDASECDEQCWVLRLISKPLDLKPVSHQFILDTEFELITKFMKNANVANFGTISAATEKFVVLESGLSEQTPKSALMIGQWIIDVAGTRGHKDMVYIQALISAFSLLKTKIRDTAELHKVWTALVTKPTKMPMEQPAEDWQFMALHAVLQRWEQDLDVETRAIILQCLADAGTLREHKTLLEDHASSFMRPIEEGLHDFTTNARGDVGSQVRIAAARAATAVLSLHIDDNLRRLLDECVMGGILRIAAEKLDKVRLEGQATLARWK
jgi:hypothetical protein